VSADEDRLKTQRAEVAALVEREVEEFYKRHPTRRPDPLASRGKGIKSNNASSEMAGEPQPESPPTSIVQTETTNKPVQGSLSEQEQAVIEKDCVEEHNGEVVVVAEEDTVIY